MICTEHFFIGLTHMLTHIYLTAEVRVTPPGLGDCLWSIPAKSYSDGTKWSVIFEANKDKIKDARQPLVST